MAHDKVQNQVSVEALGTTIVTRQYRSSGMDIGYSSSSSEDDNEVVALVATKRPKLQPPDSDVLLKYSKSPLLNNRSSTQDKRNKDQEYSGIDNKITSFIYIPITFNDAQFTKLETELKKWYSGVDQDSIGFDKTYLRNELFKDKFKELHISLTYNITFDNVTVLSDTIDTLKLELGKLSDDRPSLKFDRKLQFLPSESKNKIFLCLSLSQSSKIFLTQYMRVLQSELSNQKETEYDVNNLHCSVGVLNVGDPTDLNELMESLPHFELPESIDCNFQSIRITSGVKVIDLI